MSEPEPTAPPAPLFFECGASWYWVLFGPVAGGLLLLIQNSGSMPVRITVDTGSSVAELSTALAVAVSDQLLDTLSGLLGEGSVRLAEANGLSRAARAANGGRRR